MARSRHRLTKAITLKTIKPTLAWAQGAAYAFDFPANAARFTDRPAGNLLTSPEDFSAAAWVKSRSSVAANAVAAPDGTLTADKLVEDATATNTHRTYQIVTKASSSPLQFTFSVYLKAAERTFASIRMMDNTEADGCTVSINLTTGALGSATGIGGNAFTNLSATTTTLADGWFLATLTGTTDSDSQVVGHVFTSTALGTVVYTGDGASGIYVWGARLEAGSVAADYLAREARYYALASVPGWTFSRASTGYALNNAGQLVSFASGAPRITDRGFLAEGARTNLATYSDGTVAQLSSSSNVSDAATFYSPFAQSIAFGDNSVPRFAYKTLALTAGQPYVFSAFIQMGDGGAPVVGTNNVTGDLGIVVDNNLSTSVTIEYIGGTTYRVSGAVASAVGGGSRNNGVIKYTGQSARTFKVTGFQLENASFPSSYIPTTTASVTRAADSLTITGVTGLDYPVTLFAEFERVVDTGGNETVLYLRLDGNNYSELLVSSTDASRARVAAGGVATADLTGANVSTGSASKLVMRAATDNARAAFNGTLTALDSSCAMPGGPTAIWFGSTVATSQFSFGYVRRAAIFTRALADAELGAITL